MHLHQIGDYLCGYSTLPVYTYTTCTQDIISGAVCALLFFAVSVPMEIYNGEWTEINGIIEFIFQTELITGLTSFIEGPSAAKGVFNLDQLIPASGAATVCY